MNKQGRAAAPRLGCRPALPVGCTLGVICCWNSRFSTYVSCCGAAFSIPGVLDFRDCISLLGPPPVDQNRGLAGPRFDPRPTPACTLEVPDLLPPHGHGS